MIQSVWKNLTGRRKTSHIPADTSGVTLNADLENKNSSQTPMTCTHGYIHFIHLKNVANEVDIQLLSTLISLLQQFASAFFSSKEGGVQYFCPYNECTSHWSNFIEGPNCFFYFFIIIIIYIFSKHFYFKFY